MSQLDNPKPLTHQQAMRYSRQIMLPGFDLDKQERLLTKNILLIGVGGLGCAAAQYLVASGVAGITLVDDDVVEHSNLQRQVLHHESDIGKRKCESAKEKLTSINSQTTINTIQQRLDDKTLEMVLAKHHIVLDCSDNLATRNQLNRACLQANIPLVSGAAIRMEGQIFSMQPQNNDACYGCLSRFFGEQQLSCVDAGVLSPVVGIIGAMQALEGIKILVDFGHSLSNKLMLFDAMTMQWQTFAVKKHGDCPVCSVPT
ncbi:molybdopterin-synthase adenylyltransferase MoeB [Aliiglaciecola sp. 3_MG-2023]|uniref:molybdopterin-synthase adenylyltransferase MoeB n=1 Tax=Aliiglaciecola sp. 3_MG-2023 TaxID=3062644 RepID=UPI0026E13A6C|nr:molybdopterin-synthase adenylyltransferase MoeB [Aliiglaciecola sp. 3_MG-2023]MDO6693787.1 molybdopterin-synthase adenylyltransferase MoeB [Aliiglaciecola sp. 3_MG-2023]